MRRGNAGLGLLIVGYLLGSIPFGLIFTRLAGLGDVRGDRFRQYRRDQRAAHRPQGSRRRHPCLRRSERDRSGSHRRRVRADAGAPLRPWCISRPSLSGLAGVQRAAKASPPILGIALGLYWPAALFFAAVWLAVAFIARYSSLAALVAGLVTPSRSLLQRLARTGRTHGAARGSALAEAPAQYPEAARRHRKQDRAAAMDAPEQRAGVRLSDEQRLAGSASSAARTSGRSPSAN